MIGFDITKDKDGNPLDNGGRKLSESSYQPPDETKKLFARVQHDYISAYALQHRSFDEFDGYSLLQRTQFDQQTFGAFVGAEYVPQHKKWRWKGRKNTARNKLIGILARMISGMLFPFVNAQNEQNETDKLTARVMRILVEEHLKKAQYEMKFLYMVLSALVNPAVIVNVEYVVAYQRIKQKLKEGEIKIVEAVDELLSGIQLNIVPVDEFLISDFFTNDIQRMPNVMRVRRIPWDVAREIYAGKFTDENGKDKFEYVEAGKTRVFLSGQEHQTLYDIEWTEADRNYVQEITAYYRSEDLEVTWVGGVFMGEDKDIYNANPFQHRRMSLIGDEWLSIPVIPYAKAYFEPIDPTGRFFYGKSGAFKEYWDDAALNQMHRLAFDGTYLDVIKPLFLSGVGNVDSVVMAPGATIGMPQGAQVTPYQLGPNLAAAYNAIMQADKDMSVSTQDDVMNGVTDPNVTATQTNVAVQQARIFMGVFGVMIAELIRQIGELTMDCIIQHTTVGEVDASVPEALSMKYKNLLIKTREQGKDMSNLVQFTTQGMGEMMTEKQIIDENWKIFQENGGKDTEQYQYKVNPFKFARTRFSMFVDVDKIVMKSMGADQNQKDLMFAKLTSQFVYPFVDPKALADDVIDDYVTGDPDKFKKKDLQNPMDAMLNGMGMMGGGNGAQVAPPQGNPQPAMAGATR